MKEGFLRSHGCGAITQKKAKTLETTFYSFSKEEKLKFPSLSNLCISCVCMRPILVKIMTIKLHYKSVFLSSLNNTFFSVFVIIFSKMSYFCFNYTKTFFIHTMNYFSVVLRIIFLMCIENYFFIGPRIIFHGVAKSFLGLQCFVGVAVAVDWFEFFGRFPFTPKFWKYWLVHQMERTISVWSDRDTRDQL